MKFITRLLETITIYLIISILAVFFIAGKIHNHFPPSRAEVSELMTKISQMMARSEDTVAAVQKLNEVAATIPANMQKLVDISNQSQTRVDALEARVRSLEVELYKRK